MPLDEYRAKRSAASTPEPFGTTAGSRPNLFVIQKHAARRLHYDLRLELDGVLKSWAVPHGPSFDPNEKRLAVEVEDHPVEYADFEGTIPKGNYGAGSVIVWDRGSWEAIEDPHEGFKKGKLLFSLRGYKLRGIWQLVRTKAKPKEWLLIKKPDAWAAPEGERPLSQESVLSGLAVEEIELGARARESLRQEAERLGAPRSPVDPTQVDVMLAEARERAFSGQGWLFELKYDGYRALGAKDGPKAQLVYRRGSLATVAYPEIARALSALPCESVVLDGEIVVLDNEGKPSFQRLQRRAMLTRPLDVNRAMVDLPATYYAFDLLAFEGFDLRSLPLTARKDLLRKLVPRAGVIRYSDHIDEHGEALFEQVRKNGLEGVMAKRADSRYRGGRSGDWLKIRIERTADFAIVGYTQPKKAGRTGFAALDLAVYDGKEFIYVGRAGTGFSEDQLKEIREKLDPLRVPKPPCTGPIPKERGHVWVEPKYVCEVRYFIVTEEGILRQPAFLRMRDDKTPQECRREQLSFEPPPEAPAAAPAPEPAEKKVAFSNLDKVFWPKDGYTKGDLIEYYRVISPWLLPYLNDRPLVLTRFPDGIDGKSFFQKDAPGFVPPWVRTARMWSDGTKRETDYFICDDVETLLYVANLGSIPLHIWSSRVATLSQPDWCILDLDPKEAPFAHVIELARAIHALCDEVGLPSFPKTSGQAGLHVLIPLGKQCTYEQSRKLGHLIARIIETEHPKISTTTRTVSERGGRVYLDFMQNGYGQTLVSPFSVRPKPLATVSTPLRWDEVNDTLDPKHFTLRSVPERMKELKEDPMLPVLALAPDLAAVLERIGKRLSPTPPA